MAWSNVEFVGNANVVEVSYESFCQEIRENTSKVGKKQAIEIFVKENFDLTGTICAIKEQKNTDLFIIECDEAYNLIFEALKAVVSSVLPLSEQTRFFSALNDKTVRSIDDIIKKNINDIGAIQAKPQYSYRREEFDALKRLNNGKSVMEVAIWELDKVIQLYCNKTGKNLPKMRSRIYHTMWDGYQALIDMDYAKYHNGIFSLISVSMTAANKSKMERLERPFSSYLDALE